MSAEAYRSSQTEATAFRGIIVYSNLTHSACCFYRYVAPAAQVHAHLDR